METNNQKQNTVDKYVAEINALSPIERLQILRELREKADPRTQEEKEKDFFSTFGGFKSEKSAEEIIKEIYDARTFGSERESLDK